MITSDIDVYATRSALADADTQFIQRWSPRAFSGQALSETQLMALFEAARWAPSCFNSQPWRFVYGLSDTPEWDPLFGLLMEFNQTWVQRAGAIIAVVAKTTFDNGEVAPTHAFDAGAAWMSLALQANVMGLASHAMWGFEHSAAAGVLGLDDEHTTLAMVAVGFPGDVETLPEKLQAREVPSPRKGLDEIAFAGRLTHPSQG